MSRPGMSRVGLVVAVGLVAGLGSRAEAYSCHSRFMIVLDRSCSMNKKADQNDAQTKWEAAVTAINSLTSTFASEIDFGLTMFPDGDADMGGSKDCNQDGPIAVKLGPDNAGAISTALEDGTPGDICTTPLSAGIVEAGTDPDLTSPYTGSGDRSYLLLITDGKPTCSETSSDVISAIQALYGRGYPTYVVGFGNQVDADLLSDAALAGGVPQSGGEFYDAGVPDGGTTLYYEADNAQALDNALQAIVGKLSGEFSTCDGTPCPDGRCFTAGEVCEGGFCVPEGGDGGGAATDDASVASPDGGGPASGKHAGCGCRVGGAGAPANGVLTAALLVLLALSRRTLRRSRAR